MEKGTELQMVKDYLAIWSESYTIINQVGMCFVIRDNINGSTFNLCVSKGRVRTVNLEDCIENAKSALNYSSELINRIAAFEMKWYRGVPIAS